MEPSNSRALSPETLAKFSEGIALVLSRWTALQMAVENGWGGRESRQNSSNLADSVLSWFSQSRDTLYIDDLEDLLDEEMAVSFNTEIEDGSVEEVAEQLMVMHEGCLEGNYESIEKLRNLLPLTNAVKQSKEVINDDAGESSDEEASDMVVDEPLMPKETAVNNPNPRQMPDEDGWSVVAPKRNRGRKPG